MASVRVKALLQAVAWTLFVIILLSIPGKYVPSSRLWSYDKVGHVMLFFGLAFLWMRAFSAHNLRVILLILVCGLAFAPLTEVYQGLLSSGRQADLYDSLADAAGFALGTLAWILVERVRRKAKTNPEAEDRP